MATDFTGLKGELLHECLIRQEGGDVTRKATAKEVAGWLHEVALPLAIGKHKLAGEAGTYGKRLVEDGFGAVEGIQIAGLGVGDLTEAGMRKGDAKTLMRNVSGKCTPSGGNGSSINYQCFRPHVSGCVWEHDCRDDDDRGDRVDGGVVRHCGVAIRGTGCCASNQGH